MSKFMEVKFSVDLEDSQQVAKLTEMLQVFMPNDETPEPDKTEPARRRTRKPKEETPKEETPKEETPKEETPKEETPKEETPKEETPKEETPKEETPKETGQTVKIDEIRTLVVEKKDNHRAAIKEKLTEFGVKNVTTLAEENYETFRDFLKEL